MPTPHVQLGIKITPALSQRLRDHAHHTEQSQTAIVTAALEAYLTKKGSSK